MQYLLAVSPAIIYTTQASGDFACTFVSQNLRAIMGYSPEEMTTDPKCWPGHLHPEDAPRVFEEMRPLIERGGGTVEYRFRHRDGHYIWIQDTFRVVNDEDGRPLELVGAWADITERKSIETELSGTRQRLQYLLSVSPAIIYTTKASGDFGCTFVSENLRAIMGYSPQEMTTDPKCWPDHLHPDDAARVLRGMRAADRARRRHASSTASATATGITSGSRTASRWSTTKTAIRSSWSAPGPTSPKASSAEQAALDANIRAARHQALSDAADRKLDRRHHRHRQGRQGGAVQRGRRDAAGLPRRRGHRPRRARSSTAARSTREDVAARDAQARRHRRRLRRACCKTKDGTSIPVLISASVLFGERGEEIGHGRLRHRPADAQARGGRAPQGARRTGKARGRAHHRAESGARAAAAIS